MVSMEITCTVSMNQPSDGLWQYKSSILMLLRPFSLIMNRPVDIIYRAAYIIDRPVYIIEQFEMCTVHRYSYCDPKKHLRVKTLQFS